MFRHAILRQRPRSERVPFSKMGTEPDLGDVQGHEMRHAYQHLSILGVVLVLFLAACGNDDTSGATAGGTINTTGVSATPPTVPQGSFHQCGEYQIFLDEPDVGTEATEAQRCFVDALNVGNRARLVVTAPTDEGDPVIFTYSILDKGRFHVHEDASKDTFGPPYVREQSCRVFQPSDNSVPQTSECTEASTNFQDIGD